MKNEYDIAIVGGGLAGCTLAVELKKKNYSVCLIDQPRLSNSSRVAAGIINPIVFKRTTLSWNAFDTIHAALRFYTAVETSTHSSFLHLTSIHRILSGFEEQNEWTRKSNEETFMPFITDTLIQESHFSHVAAPHGLTEIKLSGWLDTIAFIEVVQNNIIGATNILCDDFDYSCLRISDEGFAYKESRFKKIAFCEGHLVQKNPFFEAVALYPVKGEVITIENHLNTSTVLSGGVYFVPQQNNQIKIGATYDWENLNEDPTEKGKNELMKKLGGFYKGPVNITSHQVGIRPAAKDRKPILGKHPQHANLYIFNGLGTKGVSLAPWCANLLADFIQHNIDIPREINVSRFY